MEKTRSLQEIKKSIEIYNYLPADIEWLVKQTEKLEKIKNAWLYGSGEDIDVELQEAFDNE